MTEDDDYVGVREVAELLQVTVNHARNLLREGRIPAEHVRGGLGGQRYRARRGDVDAYRTKRDRTRLRGAAPQFAGLRGIVERRKAAKMLVDDLTEERDREIVRLSRTGCVVVDLADAADLSTQQIQVIRRTAGRDPNS